MLNGRLVIVFRRRLTTAGTATTSWFNISRKCNNVGNHLKLFYVTDYNKHRKRPNYVLDILHEQGLNILYKGFVRRINVAGREVTLWCRMTGNKTFMSLFSFNSSDLIKSEGTNRSIYWTVVVRVDVNPPPTYYSHLA